MSEVRVRAEQFLSSARYRGIRYLIAGGTSAATNVVLLYALTEFFRLWYVISSLVAVSAAWLVSFLLQKFFTFRNVELQDVRTQALRHAVLSLVGIPLNTALLYLFVEYLHVWYIAAQIVVAALIACVNYVVSKRYIFV